MDIPEDDRHPAQQESEHQQSDTGKDDHCSHTGAERVDENDYRQDEEDYASEYRPSRTLDAEGLKVTAERYSHERMIHHPYAEHDRKKGHRHGRIDAQQESEEYVDDSTDKHISAHGKVIGTCRGHYKLSGTHKEHYHSSNYTQSHIALQREYKDGNAGSKAKDAGKHHEPPVLYSTADSVCQIFEMTFHGTNILLAP